MSPYALLAQLSRRGIRLWEDGGRLRYHAPDEAAFPPDLKASVRANKAELLELLGRSGSESRDRSPIPRAGDGDIPASHEQSRFLILDALKTGSATYNLTSAFRLRGSLDVAALEQAVADTVSRHGALRTRFAQREGQFIQMTADFHPVIARVDMGGAPVADAMAKISTDIENQARTPFDLMAGPHLRVLLYRISGADHVLAVIMHHLVSDGGSIALFVEELRSHYARHLGAATTPRPEPRRQYGDYAAWQHGAAAARLRRRDLDYWRACLKHLPPPLKLPARAQGTTEMSDDATLLFMDLDQLGATGTQPPRQGVTRFHLLLAALAVLLEKYSGQDDFVVGTPMSSRMGAEFNDTIGPFLNMVPLRLKPRKTATVGELIADVRRIVLDAVDHALVPFDSIVEAIKAPRDAAFMPIFQTMFVLEDTPVGIMTLHGLDVETLVFDDRLTKYDLTLIVQRRNDRWVGIFKYNTARFDPALMARMAVHYRAILAALLDNRDIRVADIPFLDDAERAQLLTGGSGPDLAPVPDKPLHQLLTQAAARYPERLAIESDDHRLTHAQFDALTDRLAARLGDRGVGVGDFVAVAMERSVAAVVAIVGVVKAGAAYAAIDPALPAARGRAMIDATGCKLVLTDGPGRSPAPGLPELVISMDAMTAPGVPVPPPVGAQVGAGDGLCVFFTSGSTGGPKAVVLDHRSMVNNLLWMQKDWPLSPDDALLLKAPLGFDVSLKEIFWPLLAGARLVVAAPGGHRDPAYLRRAVSDKGVTVIHLVPTMLDHFLSGGFPGGADEEIAGLRIVMTGGEALSEDLARRFHRRTKAVLLHLYGPTEAAIAVTGIGLGAGQPVHLGQVAPNVTVHVVDAAGSLPPPGVAGELHIGGVALAWGYLGDARLTAERFRPDPFSATPGARLYRSGDRARRGLDGKLHFGGRTDRQIKLGGRRIEPGEIEATLKRHRGVASAAVTLDRDGTCLVAFVTNRGSPRPRTAELSQFAGQRLPRHMVPTRVLWLDALPLLSNGKIDYPALGEGAREPPATPQPLSGGRRRMEDVLSAAWARVLNHHAFSTSDNFFDAGGTSLLLVGLQRDLRDREALEVSTTDFFAYPTIAALAAHLTAADPKATATPPSPTPSTGAGGGDVAIIGYAARMPGWPDLGSFWTGLCAGHSAIADISEEDLRAAGVSEETLANPNYMRRRAVLEGAEYFDAGFFRMAPAEAALLDPQARLLLELTQETLDHGAYRPESQGDRVGVFVASGRSTYFLNNLARVDGFMERFGPQQLAIATDKSFLATRISYKFGFRGPAITVDTACSSSLVAVHQARMAILNGDCETAIAGGACVDVPVHAGYFHAEGNIGSKTGCCRPFDAAADGTVKGSGAAMILLKRLDRALTDGDRICAVIRGSAVNNDGADKVSFTAPSVHGQAEVIGAALADGGLAPGDIDYVEAHGTGTALGDPIELEALGRVFGTETRLTIGSVKGNIGHLDAAAGIAGMIKAVLIAETRVLPPSGGFASMTKNTPPGAAAIRVNTETVPLGSEDKPARIGVSAFGIGGTNAHVVIESVARPAAPAISESPELLQLSAPTPASLAAYAERLASYSETTEAASGRAMAMTLALGRRRFGFRLSVVAETPATIAAGLRRAVDRAKTAPAVPVAPIVVLLVPNRMNGAPGWVAPLMRGFLVYREALDDLLAALPAASRARIDYFLRAADGNGPRPEDVNSVAFLHGVAFHRLLASWGIAPDYLIGPGEFTAAALAGVMAPEAALNLVVALSRAVGSQTGDIGPGTPALAKILATTQLKAPRLPLASSLSGDWMTAGQATDPDYWAQPRRRAGCPDGALAALLRRPGVVVLDAGPGKGLTDPAIFPRAGSSHRAISFAPSGDPDDDATRSAVLKGLGEAWEAGVENTFHAPVAPEKRCAEAMPGPPFVREKHWIEPPRAGRLQGKSAPAAPAAARSKSGRKAGSEAESKNGTGDPQSLVREIWRAQFGTAGIKDEDDFFALGGDSLGAAHILARIRDLTGARITVSDFYATPTIAGCLKAIGVCGQTPTVGQPRGPDRESIDL